MNLNTPLQGYCKNLFAPWVITRRNNDARRKKELSLPYRPRKLNRGRDNLHKRGWKNRLAGYLCRAIPVDTRQPIDHPLIRVEAT